MAIQSYLSSASAENVAGHAFVQDLRRGCYDLGTDVPPTTRLAEVFAELALAM